MVVNRHQTAAPLFWYIYRPVHSKRADNHADGGFNVALYASNHLVFTKFSGMGQQQVCTFQVPAEVIGRFAQIMESQTWWMDNNALEIKTDGPASSVSMFGFTQKHPLFSCEDIDILVQEPFNSERGMYARRMRGMLECISEMLYSCGLLLCVDGFDWNWNVIRPLEEVATPVPQQNWQQAWAQYSYDDRAAM